MNIFQQLKYDDTLTASERQFAAFIEEHTDMVLNGNLQDVVKAAYVSKSMILRFCKKLGLTGFKELKVRLAQDGWQSNDAVDTNFPFSEGDSQKAVAHKLQQLYIDTINDTVTSLQLDTLWEIVLRPARGTSYRHLCPGTKHHFGRKLSAAPDEPGVSDQLQRI